MSIELGILSTHVPRICHEEAAPEFQRPLVNGLHQAAKIIEDVQPDVVVIASTHWQSTFHHFVDGTLTHEGILTSVEDPVMVSNVPYRYPGEPLLSKQLVEMGQEEGLPIFNVDDPTYIWDYGTVVPLRYLVPNADIPVIDLSISMAASLEESYQWGQLIGKTLGESDKKAVFIASGALSHNLVRGPEKMPTLSEQSLDNQMIQYMTEGNLKAAWEMLPQYSKTAGVESGGRHLAMLFGILEGTYRGELHGYAQSSGSGNVVMTFQEIKSLIN